MKRFITVFLELVTITAVVWAMFRDLFYNDYVWKLAVNGTDTS